MKQLFYGILGFSGSAGDVLTLSYWNRRQDVGGCVDGGCSPGGQGLTVQRILSDNGSPYRSRAFARLLRRLGVRHIRTRPYRPQTNGKVERWIRTVLSECLYLEVFASSHERRLALDRFIGYYEEMAPASAVVLARAALTAR